MTDGQLGILVTCLTAGMGGVIAILRWSVTVITGAIQENTKAMIANSASNAQLSTKIDSIAVWVDGRRTPTPPPGTLIIPQKP